MKGAISLTVGLAFGLLFATAHASKPTFESLWAQVSADRDCKPTEFNNFTLMTCQSEMTLWYFTKPNHPAHPGVIKRAIKQGHGGVYVDEEGTSFVPDTGQPAFKAWLAQIQELDRQVRDELHNHQNSGR
jgi:hypothetical protein